jgi:hypothetical protein
MPDRLMVLFSPIRIALRLARLLSWKAMCLAASDLHAALGVPTLDELAGGWMSLSNLQNLPSVNNPSRPVNTTPYPDRGQFRRSCDVGCHDFGIAVMRFALVIGNS